MTTRVKVKRRRNIKTALTGMVLLATVPFANAVEINAGGAGDAVIIPLWATTLQNVSLLTIAGVESDDPTSAPVAIRLRVRDEDGNSVFAVNLYFPTPLDTWTASLMPAPEGGTLLSSGDATCALIEVDGQVQVMNAAVTLPVQAGYMEAFTMAGGEGVARALIGMQDCQGLAAKWNSGSWANEPNDSMLPPVSQFRAVVQMVDVPKGTSYVVEGTALGEFTDIAQHTRPGADTPNLGTAHDSGTPEGATRSRLCLTGACLEDVWADPRNAVAAALMVHRISGDYSREPNLAAKTDVVITYPLRHLDTEEGNYAEVAVEFYKRNGGRYNMGTCGGPPPYPEYCTSLRAFHSQSIGVMSMNQPFAGNDIPSAILGLNVNQEFPIEQLGQLPEAGWFRAAFDRMYVPALVSSSGRKYYGEPAISVILQEYTNGNLPAPDGVTQRANYGLARQPVRQTWPDDYP